MEKQDSCLQTDWTFTIYRTTIDQKSIQLDVLKESAPLVIAIAFEKMDQALIEACQKIECRKFNLLSITNLQWDEELSPWAHDPVVMINDHFTGQAPELLKTMDEKIIPWTLSKLKEKPKTILISGYSMGGLFALYSLYNSNCFEGCACVSGSVWYPDFENYALSHQLASSVKAVYFSLGNKEAKVSNPFLQTTGQVMEKLCDHYQNSNVDSVFELNPGNHFTNPIQRLAKGIKWLLIHTQEDA
ncbi:alpha/beta hydrolase-fold protein [Ileibacterium valens]|uniref:Esterase n=1 Tax=Ileibacterium valens TaxID=1862668 RepID=A0A1U7NES7_9FIRM|nr:alpha/beta hydrolase-fold protein [Ileibacterium valens]OLU37698.1 hypothetical protein BM735_10220 [Erysipelotrichaceae bacterium NYU-BL-F16]OLU38318.1 hypothetical protein BO222_08650 [Ileibacterium valens]OLU38380.1 hypothetical protein BO224_09155 [Erysipelotrichaceae bacterium NYU-BL-E8]